MASDLKSELSGSFEDFSVALIQEPDQVLANDLYAAMKGWGTDEDTITEVNVYTLKMENGSLSSCVFHFTFAHSLTGAEYPAADAGITCNSFVISDILFVDSGLPKL